MITPEDCIAEWESHDCTAKDGGPCTDLFEYNCTVCGKLLQEHGEAIPGNIEYGWICVNCYYEDAANNTFIVAIPVENVIHRDEDGEIPF